MYKVGFWPTTTITMTLKDAFMNSGSNTIYMEFSNY